jgi:hypothetical protein
MVGAEQEGLGAIVPLRDRLQHSLHGVGMGDITAREHGKGAEAQTSAQYIAAIYALDQAPVLLEWALIDAAGRPET